MEDVSDTDDLLGGDGDDKAEVIIELEDVSSCTIFSKYFFIYFQISFIFSVNTHFCQCFIPFSLNPCIVHINISILWFIVYCATKILSLPDSSGMENIGYPG